MKLVPTLICTASLVTASFAHAANTNTQPLNVPYVGHVHLDQSKDVFFDQLEGNSFSLSLLQVKNKFAPYDMILGGSLQSDLQHWTGDKIETIPQSVYENSNGFYLTQLTADVMNNINPWVATYLSLGEGHIQQSANSVFIQHAFVLFGNQDKYPLYLTVGINNIPFGVFSGSGPWDSPLTGAYFNPSQAPQVSLGYVYNNWNAVITRFDDTVNQNLNNAFLISYNKSSGTVTFSLGGGYLSDLKTNNTGTTPIARTRTRKIAPMDMGGVIDVNASIGYKNLSLTGEYARGTAKVADNKKKPNGLSFSLSYTPTIYGQTTTFGLGYSITSHLKQVPIPLSGEDMIPLTVSGIKNNWALSVSRPIFIDNLVLGLEAEQSTLYSKKQTKTFTADLIAYI